MQRLDRSVDSVRDHVVGAPDAEITLVEYGSYDCPHCRAANARITEVRDQLGDRVRYVFRHRPISGSELARRAADLVEQAATPDEFWSAHVSLMTRSRTLTEDDLRAVAEDLRLDQHDAPTAQAMRAEAVARVDQDVASSHSSGVRFTPTFFINGQRYDGPWDEASFTDAMLGSLGHRVRTAALGFASWAPSAGVMLLLATVLAIVFTNSQWGAAFAGFWENSFGISFGDSGFHMSLAHWVNDALLTVFFLVVGLEIKREFTVGHLATRRSAALPIAAAIGGMAVPALIYVSLVPAGSWQIGWGVPMATDTAFAVALIAIMGPRVPVELRIFLTAAAIVDDIGAIVVVAIFYSDALNWAALLGALATVGFLGLLNRWSVYRATPYVVAGIVLWACVHAGGLHATLAGVLLATFIPTRPPPDYRALVAQADAILSAEASHGGEQFRHGPSAPALRELDAIHDRLESPADRLLRQVAPRSSYFVLPIFALANAGVAMAAEVLTGHGMLMAAIICGLALGKPAGFVLASWLAVKAGIAEKPAAYSWRQLAGAGALAGIGFTMSLFIAGQAFPEATDFAAAKIAVFAASVLSAVIGMAVLWGAPHAESSEGAA
ncbi:MAG TPA: Na+/H+ antiporter NhaA [Steroidobacteraceae bacterium]|nr:Na+/H+ antiporter NhaA [Steroidobacteraceae bacterium]